MPRASKDQTAQTVLAELREIKRIVTVIWKQNLNMSRELDNLTTEVEESKTVQQSAIALLNGLGEQIRNAASEPEKLQALADSLDSKATELANAIAANTVAAGPTAKRS